MTCNSECRCDLPSPGRRTWRRATVHACRRCGKLFRAIRQESMADSWYEWRALEEDSE